jgi:hypothetical protein
MAKICSELLESIQENIMIVALNDVTAITFPVFTNSLQTLIPVLRVLNVLKPDEERMKGNNSRRLYKKEKSREN